MGLFAHALDDPTTLLHPRFPSHPLNPTAVCTASPVLNILHVETRSRDYIVAENARLAILRHVIITTTFNAQDLNQYRIPALFGSVALDGSLLTALLTSITRFHLLSPTISLALVSVQSIVI
jgi:hypothetical protein